MKYILSIDLGTTNIKSILFDQSGNNVRQASFELTTLNPQEGHFEQDPDEIIHGTLTTISQLNIRTAELYCVVLSGAMHSIFPVNQAGKPLSHALLWSDLRSSDIAHELKHSSEGKAIHHETGTPVHPMSPICKLIWLGKYTHDIFNKAYKFISLKEYLIHYFTGQFIVDQSLASATGLMNLAAKEWSGKALKIAGIKSDQLSELKPPSHMLPISNGTLSNTPLILGGGDGCLANLGSGVINQNQVALTIGTSAAIRNTITQPSIDKDFRTFCYYVDEGLYISGGAMNNGGNIFPWLKENYNVSEMSISDVQPGSGGLITLPYVYGERAPFWEANMKMQIFNQQADHTSNEIARSFIEGISYNLLLISESLQEFDQIIASGGFTKSSFWPQMIADIFGKPVHLLQTPENTALGAMFLAMKSLGQISSYQEIPTFLEISHVLDPDNSKHKIYQQSFEQFKELATLRHP